MIVRTILAIFLPVLFFSSIAAAGGINTAAQLPRPATNKTYSVVSSNADEVIIDVTPAPYADHFIDVDGRQMRQIDGELSGWTSEAGKPSLPSAGFLVALPPGKIPVVDIIESKFTTGPTEEIAPAPSYTFSENGDAIPHYHADPVFYAAHNQFYPQTIFETGDIARIRDLQTVKIIIYPVQYNPVAKQLKRFSHITVRVRFQQNMGKTIQAWMPVTDPDPYFEKMYNGLVLNYKDASQWRTRPLQQVSQSPNDSTRTWFQTGRQYYRIPVITDGLYHLSYNTLLGFGIHLSAINTASIALYDKGHSVPLYVHIVDSLIQQSYIEFYGQRNHGPNSFYNRYSDTNSYWFTWNDNSPAHYSEVSTSVATTDTVTWTMNNFWNEQDLNYFFGVTQDDLLTTTDVAGEGWYWADFVPGQSKVFPFTIDTLQRKTGVPVQLQARFFGMTATSPTPSQHRAFLYINRVLIDSISWQQNTEAIFSRTFPDSLLRKGKDTLKIVSNTWPPDNISKFYLDWFQVTYPRTIFSTTSNILLAATPTGKPVTAFRVNGIPADSATIIDVTNGRKITALTKINATTFVFKDSAASARTYFIVKEAGKLLPARMDSKTFTDLRVNTTGADYLLITHATFRSQADRLAQYHASHDKLRTAIVDVQDIYDQFNYGLLDPTSIKSFLKYSYYNWRHPSPTYAVFFGDASWDFKKNLSTSVKVNYVPSYGNPPSDNVFVCFDSVYYYLPFMIAGRIPVSTLQEATSVVNKVIGYGTPSLTDWTKSFLFITGGATPSEKNTFNFYSDQLISQYVTTAPIGGTVDKVYKTSDDYVDGEFKPLLQSYVAGGLGFINFIGHSGGRVWGVDIGSPYQMLNTNGMLPFVSSVSCNVGFFSDPASNVLSEDFLLADNRGAVAVWAASSLGYATVGRLLVDKFLNLATQNYSRDIGLMTTLSRINFWVLNNRFATPLIIESLNLHPLIGDPATQLALPTYPDFAISTNDISIKNNPPLADSTVTLLVHLKNFGLMAGSPIRIAITDSYTDESGARKGVSSITPSFYIPDFMEKDSFTVSLNVQGKPGSHDITVSVDPLDSITEVNKSDNVAEHTFYIYRNSISVIAPSPYKMVPTLTPILTVTTPAGNDTTPLTYYFEIDTVSDFTSIAKIISGPVPSGRVSASWQTPTLLQNKTYYWRAQNSAAIGATPKQGAWITSTFQTTAAPLPADTVVWQQNNKQFLNNTLTLTSVNDSGATLLRSDSTTIYVRSLGFRANSNIDYYGEIQINTVTAFGLWFDVPYSYLAAWYNPINGTYQNMGFNFLTPTGVNDMINFLKAIPNGDYVMLSAIWDAKQNATDSLTQLIKQLGSVKIDSLQRGQSWMLISRKGYGPNVEVYNSTVAEGTIKLGNVYHSGAARIVSPPIGPANHWGTTTWNISLPNASAQEVVQILGMKNDTATDTLMTLPSGTSFANLSAVNPATYPRIKLLTTMSCTDGASSPVLRQWNVHYFPTADLAINAWTVVQQTDTVVQGTPYRESMTIYNTGAQRADSSRVSCFIANDTLQRFDAVIDTLAPGSHRQLEAQFVIKETVSGNYNITSLVAPKIGSNDLLPDNNAVYSSVYVKSHTNGKPKLRILFDNVELRDGDFVSPNPVISIEYPPAANVKTVSSFITDIDGKEIHRVSFNSANAEVASAGTSANIKLPVKLADGMHSIDLGQIDGQTGGGTQSIMKIQFQVASAASIRDVFNYPNPFGQNTVFSFIITGAQVPNDLKLKVYSVAGRIIRTIPLMQSQLRLGYNRIAWDGRDDQGDEIANGTYFYKISMNSGTESADALQRLVKLR